MKTKDRSRSIYPDSITVYSEKDRIDAADLQVVMRRNLREGAAGFFVGGSSGECFSLTQAERLPGV